MRICVIAPSADYLALAGVRIRYNRIADHLRSEGHTFTIELLDEQRPVRPLPHDIYLFSKCHDARSLLLARLLRQAGARVGFDLFDDYFSQAADSRFTPQRDWLTAMGRNVDYALASTPRMQTVGAAAMPRVPIHVLNDPFDDACPERIADAARQARTRTLDTGCIDVAWFGTGDNPYFPVGLDDLHAYADALAALSVDGHHVRLRILTNARALTPERLEALHRLPVEWTLDEWTLEREQALLASSLVAFIPVNAQPFSIAKSLNRAVSALTAGAQVLSNGYPLYAPLGEFIYKDARKLLDDLAADQLLLRAERLPTLRELLDRWGDPAREATAWLDFLHALDRPVGEPAAIPDAAPVAVIHGVRSLGAVHQLAQRLKQLSVGSPFSSPALNYDLCLVADDRGRPLIQLSENAWRHMEPSRRRGWASATSRLGRPVHHKPLAAGCPGLDCAVTGSLHTAPRATQLQTYTHQMSAMARLVATCFEAAPVVRSESEAPFHCDADTFEGRGIPA